MNDLSLVSQSIVLFITMFVMLSGVILSLIPLIPLIPGTAIIWAAAIGYGLIMGWDKLGWPAFILMTLLLLMGIIVDAVAGHFGAKMGGASWLAVLVGMGLGFILGIVASLIGTPLLGCFVGLLATFGGVLLVEYRRRGDWQVAIQATKGYAAGSVVGVIAKITSAILMFGVFLARVYLWP